MKRAALLLVLLPATALAQAKAKAVDACAVLPAADIEAITGDDMNSGRADTHDALGAWTNYGCAYRGKNGWRVTVDAWWGPIDPTNGMLHVGIGTDLIYIHTWGKAPGAGTLEKTRALMEKALAHFATLK